MTTQTTLSPTDTPREGRGLIPSINVLEPGRLPLARLHPRKAVALCLLCPLPPACSEFAPSRRRATNPAAVNSHSPLRRSLLPATSVKATSFLIANERLELDLSHRKESPLKIPNRKWMAVSHLTSRSPEPIPSAQKIRASRASLGARVRSSLITHHSPSD